MAQPDPAGYMQRAIALAEEGWGGVQPNPLVGAVVVRDGQIVGEGYHAHYGGPHAEVVALRAAGENTRGATLYVSLEPCNHHGQTPPCTDRILQCRIARVVFGASDPNPLAAGGAARLRAAGLDVVGDVATREVRAQNASFFFAIERRQTFVALKYALTLDARLAEAEGQRSAITSAQALEDVMRLRAGFDAIVIGSGTAAADDPQLTVRGAARARVQPCRVVIDSSAALRLDSKLAQTARQVPVRLFCTADAPRERRAALEGAGVVVETVARGPGGVALDAVRKALWEAGIRSALCEGGARLGSSLLALDLVERMYLYYAPSVYGPGGVAGFAAPLSPAHVWQPSRVASFGPDTLIVLDRVRSA
jgi:diaminohydroxyphosphoribosylaminopyrimidine deaminase/5-amino-6-(5-phosphoribosylamino)uracil reductase